MAKAAVAPKPIPIGELIDRLWSIREDKRALDARVKILEQEYDEVEERIKHALDGEKLEQGRGSRATASIILSEVPQIEDWDDFLAWVNRTKNFQLFERRIKADAWREVKEKTGRVPRGTVPFQKRKLSLVTITAKE